MNGQIPHDGIGRAMGSVVQQKWSGRAICDLSQPFRLLSHPFLFPI